MPVLSCLSCHVDERTNARERKKARSFFSRSRAAVWAWRAPDAKPIKTFQKKDALPVAVRWWKYLPVVEQSDIRPCTISLRCETSHWWAVGRGIRSRWILSRYDILTITLFNMRAPLYNRRDHSARFRKTRLLRGPKVMESFCERKCRWRVFWGIRDPISSLQSRFCAGSIATEQIRGPSLFYSPSYHRRNFQLASTP